MYDQFYGFTGMPFQLTPDSRFFYGSKGHSRAIAHLTYGLAQGEGFIVVTGEVGAGKTTLVERLWSQLDRNTYTLARISTTQVSGDDLFRLTAAGFGLDTEAGAFDSTGRLDKSLLLRRFEAMLREHRNAGRRCLLVVDEVQNLSVAALEELRMLSNITEDGQASLQTILLGQPQFRRMLASPELDQLRQRVLASYHLGPLSEDETRAYIEHRLAAVGWAGNPVWRDDAFAAVFRHTDGIPRRINRLCSRVLLYGALEESSAISRSMVETTAEELQKDLEGDAAPSRSVPSGSFPQAGPQGNPALGHPALGHLAHDLSAAVMIGRIEALEEAVARRERVFQRLLDVFGQTGAGAGAGGVAARL